MGQRRYPWLPLLQRGRACIAALRADPPCLADPPCSPEPPSWPGPPFGAVAAEPAELSGVPEHPELPERLCQPLRLCLLSGGESRRMGRDKALLPHPEGGTWLERTLRLLAQLEAPITLMSRHPEHLEQARALGAALRLGAGLTAVAEPSPWQGPLRALARLMERHPDERLLLCPVDMPWLDAASLRALTAASAEGVAATILLAHDGTRLQPLLGIYPATAARRQRLRAALAAGELGLQRWLAGEHWRAVPLKARALANVNTPEDWYPNR